MDLLREMNMCTFEVIEQGFKVAGTDNLNLPRVK